MPKCSVCGTEMSKLPPWLNIVNVNYRCGKCPETAPQGLVAPTVEEEDEAEAPVVAAEVEELDASLEEEIEAELEEEAEEV